MLQNGKKKTGISLLPTLWSDRTWNDRSDRTWKTNKTEKIPIVVNDYNNCTGGIDRDVQHLASYPEVKSKEKYYGKIFSYFLDHTIWNLLVIYSRQRGSKIYVYFMLSLKSE